MINFKLQSKNKRLTKKSITLKFYTKITQIKTPPIPNLKTSQKDKKPNFVQKI